MQRTPHSLGLRMNVALDHRWPLHEHSTEHLNTCRLLCNHRRSRRGPSQVVVGFGRGLRPQCSGLRCHRYHQFASAAVCHRDRPARTTARLESSWHGDIRCGCWRIVPPLRLRSGLELGQFTRTLGDNSLDTCGAHCRHHRVAVRICATHEAVLNFDPKKSRETTRG